MSTSSAFLTKARSPKEVMQKLYEQVEDYKAKRG